jgi:hypothetical protein
MRIYLGPEFLEGMVSAAAHTVAPDVMVIRFGPLEIEIVINRWIPPRRAVLCNSRGKAIIIADLEELA